jgi:hypothetical protein
VDLNLTCLSNTLWEVGTYTDFNLQYLRKLLSFALPAFSTAVCYVVSPHISFLFILSLWGLLVYMVEWADWLDDRSLPAKIFIFAGYGPVSGGAPPTCRPPVTQAPASNGPTPQYYPNGNGPAQPQQQQYSSSNSAPQQQPYSTSSSTVQPQYTTSNTISQHQYSNGPSRPPMSSGFNGPPVYQQRWKVLSVKIWCRVPDLGSLIWWILD